MKRKMIAVFDKVAQMYQTPIFVASVGVAIRIMQDELRRGGEENVFAKHPGDFSMVVVGEFDDISGEIDLVRNGEKVLDVVTLVEEKGAGDVS